MDGLCRYKLSGNCSPARCICGKDCKNPGPCEVAEGAICDKGKCIYKPKICDNPPPPECNGSVYRTYSETGICVDETCEYQVTETECVEGCDAGCTCTENGDCTSPGQCEIAEGICEPGNGTPPTCVYQDMEDGSTCDDGNACTKDDYCSAGSCQPGTGNETCSAGPCQKPGACDPATGICSDPVPDDTLSCDDGNACTIGDYCSGGSCQPGTTTNLTCPAGPCQKPGTCDPATGTCSAPVPDDSQSCSDGNACTIGDYCSGGSCQPGTGSGTCSAGPCQKPGACDPSTGTCSAPVPDDSQSCSDGNACTSGDYCSGGSCHSGRSTVTCSAGTCQKPGTCNPSTGTCSAPVPDDSQSCSDGNACTSGDYCSGGSCRSGTPKTCTASDQCHKPGTCDSGTGQCSNPVNTGAACSRPGACVTGATCDSSGVCQGGASKCTKSDTCSHEVCGSNDTCTLIYDSGPCGNCGNCVGGSCSEITCQSDPFFGTARCCKLPTGNSCRFIADSCP